MKNVLALAALFLSACITLPSPHAPGAEKVVFTHDAKVVAGCKIVGPVRTARKSDVEMGLGGVGQSENRIAMQNAALAAGGDAVWVSRTALFDGIAYNCSGVESRQPVPVTPK